MNIPGMIWNTMNVENCILDIAKSKLGESYPGGRSVEKEPWWWTDQTHKATTAKKVAFKKWQQSKDEEDREVNKATNKVSKKAVVIAKEEAYYAAPYKELDTAEGNKMIHKLAKTRNRRTKDIVTTSS